MEKKIKLTKEQYKSLELITKRGVLSFPKVFKKGSYQGKETNYSYDICFPKQDEDLKKDKGMEPFRKKLFLAKTLYLGKDQKKWPKGGGYPIKDGDVENDNGNAPMPGYWVVRATSANKIPVYDNQADPEQITEESDVYGGAICRAFLSAAWYKISSTNYGVKFYTNGLQKMADGERLGGGANSKARFTETPDDETEDSEDPDNYDSGDEDGDDI